MADDFLDKEESLEHTAEAGGAAKSRVEELLEQIGEMLGGLAENTSRMAEHLATLQLQKAAEDVPATARETVNEGIDTAGAAGNVGTKAIDVPLAASEDVIHDTAETVNEAKKDVARARRIFNKRKRRG
jgi:hypothetical protein